MKLLSISLVLLVSIPSCEAFVRCYSCSTTQDTRCGDAFAFTTTDTSQCMGTCVKRRGTRDINGVRTIEITRGCITQSTERCYDGNYNGISVRICTCNADYCNSAQGSNISVMFLILPTMLSMLYRYCC